MIDFFKKDLNSLIRARDPIPGIQEDSDCKFLLEVIIDACENAKTPKETRLYLERGIELTGKSAEELAQHALSLGYSELAEAYRSLQ